MRRVLSLFLPQWPIDRRRLVDAWRDRPFALVANLAGRRIVTAVNAAAAQDGIAPGTSLTDARAARPDLKLAEADFAGDVAALTALARWCDRFSPFAAPCGTDGIALDITGGAHLFGDEAGLATQLIERLSRQGIASRAAIADTLGAAWAMARFGAAALAVVPRGGARQALADLPVMALRLEAEAAELLLRLGLRRIGDLDAMPRSELAARCGGSVARASRSRRLHPRKAAGRTALSPSRSPPRTTSPPRHARCCTRSVAAWPRKASARGGSPSRSTASMAGSKRQRSARRGRRAIHCIFGASLPSACPRSIRDSASRM